MGTTPKVWQSLRVHLRRNWYVAVALMAMAMVISLSRIRMIDEPLERDITTYSLIGRALTEGQVLYTDVWDHKPPGIYWIYAAVIKLLGMGPLAVYWLGVAGTLAGLPGIYFAGRAVGGRPAGLVAAGFWTVISGDFWLEANQPNAEVFFNVLLIWAAVLYFSRSRYCLRPGRALALGLLFAAASLLKQTVLTIPAFLCLAHLLFVPKSGGRSRKLRLRRFALRDVALVWAAVVAAWASLFAFFAVNHTFANFYAAVVEYNRDYSGNIVRNLLASFHPSALAPGCLKGMTPLVVIALLGMYFGPRGENRRNWEALRYIAYGTLLSIGLPGKWWPHYYQYWLPLLAICGGWVWNETAMGGFLSRHRREAQSGRGDLAVDGRIAGLSALSLRGGRPPGCQVRRGGHFVPGQPHYRACDQCDLAPE